MIPQMIITSLLSIQVLINAIIALKKVNSDYDLTPSERTTKKIGSVLGAVLYYSAIVGLLAWGGFYSG